MAQFYHILDYKGLPVSTLAALVAGLPEESRIKTRLNGRNGKSLTELLLAVIADGIKMLVWMQSVDGARGQNRPKSIYEELIGDQQDPDVNVYDSPEEFMAERERILAGKEETT